MSDLRGPFPAFSGLFAGAVVYFGGLLLFDRIGRLRIFEQMSREDVDD